MFAYFEIICITLFSSAKLTRDNKDDKLLIVQFIYILISIEEKTANNSWRYAKI